MPAQQREAERGGEARTHRGRTAVLASEAEVPAPKLAPFCGIAPPAVDSPAWPVHPALWIGPSLTMTAPRASGLCVERRHRIPARGFCAAVAPLPGSLRSSFEARTAIPDCRLRIPRSRLTPAGWDPRSVQATSDRDVSSVPKSETERSAT